MSDATTLDEKSTTAEIVAEALDQWVALTGVSQDQTTFRMGDMDVYSMNEVMKKAMELDPEGTTTYLLLECFLRDYLERKSFTAAQIMKDYEKTSAYLQKAELLFSVVQSERALELASQFRARVTEGVRHYKSDRDDVMEMINDADVLPFLRRDALHSLESLKPYQFLRGPASTGPAQVIEHIYQAWNINDLLIALRDMPVSGIAVVLLRDPAHPDRSYFSFAMRNGENVILFTDKNKPAYPGQEDVLAGRGSRGTGRSYMSRAWSNHFPYQIIKTGFNEKGDVYFKPETTPVAAGKAVVPLMKMSDLPPEQVVWLTMMLSLISEKFWKQSWQAEALSYTGEMVRNKALLVTDGRGENLPMANDYAPIALDDVKVDDITREALDAQLERPTQGVHAWMEERYRDTVTHDIVNQWFTDAGTALMLPRTPEEHSPPQRRNHEVTKQVAPGIFAVETRNSLPSWEQPKGYKLQTFSATDFGTEEEIRNDRIWVARHNFAKQIQKAADDEHKLRAAEVAAWYNKAVEKNLPYLLQQIAEFSLKQKAGTVERGDHFIRFAPVKDHEWRYDYRTDNPMGEGVWGSGKWRCVLTDAVSTYRAMFVPRTAQDLALLCGCEIDGLPDVLQHWSKNKDYVGNHLLNRLDPMDTIVENPWKKFGAQVNVFLSKRGLAQIEKRHG